MHENTPPDDDRKSGFSPLIALILPLIIVLYLAYCFRNVAGA